MDILKILIKNILNTVKKNFTFSKMVLKVRKCPYCDNINLAIRIDIKTNEKWIECPSCLARGPKDFSAVTAIRKWGIIAHGSGEMAKLAK